MSDYNSPIEFNWLGVAFTSDRLPEEVSIEVNNFMDELLESAQKRFEQWLDAHNLECIMGVIVEKGTVPQPKPQPDFIRYRDYRIYPNDDNTCFTVYHESSIGTGAADYIADTLDAAFAHINSNPVVIKSRTHISDDKLECETHACGFNNKGICRYKETKGVPPVITESDGCISGIINPSLL